MKWNALVPELIVTDLEKSYYFWVNILGFSVKYQRTEDKFKKKKKKREQFMLEELQDDQWVTGELNYPLGRGINFQLEVKQLDDILNRLHKAQWSIFSGLEERWYRAENVEHGQKQFLVQDPDGYLLRIIAVIGDRAIS